MLVVRCVCVCARAKGDLSHHQGTDTDRKMLSVDSASLELLNHTSHFYFSLLHKSTHSPTSPVSSSCSFRNKAYSLDHLLLINSML